MDWCYGSAQQLQECLEETKVLLLVALPLVEQEIAQRQQDKLTSIGTNLSRTESMDFHQAARQASVAVTSVYPQFSRLESAWCYETIGLATPGARSRFGSIDRIWKLLFADDLAERVMLVHVPFAGALRFALGDMLFVREADGMRQASPKSYADELLAMPDSIQLLGSVDCRSGYPGDEFISTARLLKIVNENGGLEFAAKLSCYGRDISLTNDRTPTWRVCYRALEGQNVFVAEVDATSGAVTQAGIVDPK